MAFQSVHMLLSWPFSILPAVCGYVLVCSALRNQRARSIIRRYGYLDRASFAKMTDDDAQKIQLEVAELEFPRLFEMSLQFALFKTYGIPSISKLLVKTRQLSVPANATKRYADTDLLITEFVTFPPSHPRAIEAIARMNYLHGMWINEGLILNQDLLYTLALFALEPTRWINRYEWRKLTEVELCAIGTFWKSIGDGMGISYEELPSHSSGWRDGLDWLEEIERWADKYEEGHMVPHLDNKKLADETTNLLLWYVPKVLKNAGFKAVTVLMGPRLVKAMMYDSPSPVYEKVVIGILRTRQYFLRYLSLPRPEFLRARYVEEKPDPKTGRYCYNKYLAHPWYVRVTFWSRWGPESWITRLLGGVVPGDDGSKYFPGGYHMSEVGPMAFRNKGGPVMEKEIEKLSGERNGRCPFALVR